MVTANLLREGTNVDSTEEGVTVSERPTVPEITISRLGPSSIDEGQSARFIISASPAPSSNLVVNIDVDETGSFIIGTPPSSVTISGGSSSYTLSLPTDDDLVDEPDGEIEVTIESDTVYRVGAPSSASVDVEDDDPFPPSNVPPTVASQISDKTFTVGDAATTIVLEDKFSDADGDTLRYTAISSQPGVATASVPVTGSSLTLTPVAAGTATITVTARDRPPRVPGGLSVSQSFDVTVRPSTSTITIARHSSTPLTVTEGQSIQFTLTASSAPAAALTVNVSVTQAGSFLTGTPPSQTTIASGSTTADLILQTEDDTVDEMTGTVTATVLTDTGYKVGSPSSTGVIVLDDDKPAKPSNFRINGHLEDGEVTMRWYTNPEANEYQVQYQELDCKEGELACDTVGDWVMTTGNASGSGSAKEATLGGLSRFTVYQVQVKAVAVDASDEWSDITLVWPTSETVTVSGTSVASTPLHNYVADGTYTYQLCDPAVAPQGVLDPVPVPDWFDADAVFRASQEWQNRVVWSLGASGNIIKIVNNGTVSDCRGGLGNRSINLVMFLSPKGADRHCGDDVKGCIAVDPGNMNRPSNWTTIVLRADETVMTEPIGSCIRGHVTAVHEFGHGVGGVHHNSLQESIMSANRRPDLCAPTIYDEVPVMGNYQSRQ